MRIARATIPSHAMLFSDTGTNSKMKHEPKTTSKSRKKEVIVIDNVDDEVWVQEEPVLSIPSKKALSKETSSDDSLSLIGLYIIDTRIEEVVRQLTESQNGLDK